MQKFPYENLTVNVKMANLLEYLKKMKVDFERTFHPLKPIECLNNSR